MIRLLETYEDVPMWILAAYFNGVMQTSLDISGSQNKQGSIPLIFREWMTLENVVDIWRHCNGGTKNYTYFSSRYKTHSRIDYIFVSKSMITNTMTAKIGLRKYADHAPVVLSWQKREKIQNTYIS